MARHRARPRPPRVLPAVSLVQLEPYVVLFTVAAGALSLFGLLVVNVPVLVATCWFLFLARTQGSLRGVRLVRYAPALLSVAAGMVLDVLLPVPGGARVALLAFLSAGLTGLLLPTAFPGARPLSWSLRSG